MMMLTQLGNFAEGVFQQGQLHPLNFAGTEKAFGNWTQNGPDEPISKKPGCVGRRPEPT
jgi:hypothetical protein